MTTEEILPTIMGTLVFGPFVCYWIYLLYEWIIHLLDDPKAAIMGALGLIVGIIVFTIVLNLGLLIVVGVPMGVWMLITDPSWDIAIMLMVLVGIGWFFWKLAKKDASSKIEARERSNDSSSTEDDVTPEEQEALLDTLEKRFEKGAF